MSILSILQTLERLHTARGHLQEIDSNLRIFQNARNFRPRSSDDWDLLNNRDDNLRQIVRVLGRVKRITARLGRETGPAPNHSRELSRLFGTWAAAHAENGADSRQAQQAQTAFIARMLQWNDELGNAERDSRTAGDRFRKMRTFYERQADLFGTLKTIATQFVRHWPNSAQQAQALAWMLDFERIEGDSNRIARDYSAGISGVARWRRNLATARRELTTWINWSRNRGNVNQSLSRGQAPR